MPYPSLSFAQMLDNATRQELEQFVSLLTGYLSQQHTDTGAHGDVTASTITVSGNATVEGDLAVNGLITSDADGYAPTFGAFTGGSGVRLPAATTGFSDWTIAAVTGTSPSKRLHFV